MADTPSRVLSTRRVFPTTPTTTTTTIKLSIADASVARFAPCSAIWFYDAVDGMDAHDPILFKRLEQALKRTLDDYPHYSGQLQWTSAGDAASPRHLGRPMALYGTSEDPGVELVIVEDSRELSAVVPSREERTTTRRLWDATDFPQNDMLAKTTLAFSNLAKYEGLPGAAAQLTAFKCSGFAVSIKLTHCLSDAMCLLQFVHSWASHSRLLFRGSLAKDPCTRPLLDPTQLDRHANLNVSEPRPDADRIRTSRSLPMHRFDWWATDAPGYPSWATESSNATKPSDEELQHLELSPSTFPPWPTWDLAAPVRHLQIRFAADEVARMKAAAQSSLPDALQGYRVSRQDAALAHIWMLINRARKHEGTADQVYMDITLGLRGRVQPPLPDNFVGSPILLAYVAKTGQEASTASIGAIAGAIRQTMSLFTPDAVSAYLYDVAHEISPQRLWQTFLGSHHTLVTSWARARAYEVDFGGTEGLARYVQGVMPKMDGLVNIMDIAETGDFDVSLCLEEEAVRRLVADPLLRAYEHE